MKGRSIKYEAEELAWIEARRDWVRSDLHSAFCAFWKRDDISLTNLKALCKRKGWMTGRTGCFHKGQQAHNKGKPMPDHVREKCLKTAFRKGNMPHNAKGHGHERIDGKDGYVVMIVAETNPWSGAATRPVHKHRYLWEQANGPVPEGHALKCLDGNKLNVDPSNWKLIPRGMLPRLNSKRRLKYDAAPAELKPTIMLIAEVEHAVSERRSEASK